MTAWKLLGFLVIVALAVVAIKIAFAFLFLAGLIFKPKETLILLALLGMLALFRNYPATCFTLAIIVIVLTLGRIVSKEGDTGG
ncbi:hypothetical protein [Sphingomonas sp.]|uniref:hypothetical protein n=1 Tax=Sphingomonas sp. TaxID=28214 RepID=UPI003CC67222